MFKRSLSFDDVLLVPKYSEIISRKNINLTVKMNSEIHVNNRKILLIKKYWMKTRETVF